MELGFGGEVVDFYQKYRRGYPAAVIDALVATLDLTDEDTVVDLGCGTGQLARPLADRVGHVVAMDPEPAMLDRARQVGHEQGRANITYVLGADTDLPALAPVMRERAVAAVTVGQALHWMEADPLFRTVAPMVRPGGGIAIVTNGRPAWLHDTPWSRSLRGFLEQWLGAPMTRTCGSDDESQQRYADQLAAAGFEVSRTSVGYDDTIDLDQLVGGLYSAFPVDRLPRPEQRPLFAEQVRQALRPHDRVTEQVQVVLLIGRIASR